MTAYKHIYTDTLKITAFTCLATFLVFRIFGIWMAREHVIMLLITAFIIATLLTTVKRQSQELIKKSHRLEILLENSSRLRRCVTIRDVENEVAERIVQLMDLSVIFYLRGEGDHTLPFHGPDFYPKKGVAASELEFLRSSRRRPRPDG